MPEDHMNFRFYAIEEELSALGEYLNVLEEQLQFLRDQRIIQTKAKLKEEGLGRDDLETEMAYQEMYYQTEYVYPKFFRGPFIVSLWAVYESAINEVSGFIQNRMSKPLKISDIRGDNFLDRAQKYFDHVLDFPLHTGSAIIDELKDLYTIRNSFAHANGRLPMGGTEKKSDIEKLIERQSGLSRDHGYVVIEGDFLYRLYTIVNDGLRELIRRTRDWDDRLC